MQLFRFLILATIVGCHRAQPSQPPQTTPATVVAPSDPSPVIEPEPEPEPVVTWKTEVESREAEPAPPVRPAEPRVVLVTVDGVRWQDVFGGADPTMLPGKPELARPEGLMPRTWALVGQRGVALGRGQPADPGATCGLVRPHNLTNVSLPSYFEIFVGHRTSCLSNYCQATKLGTVLDAAADAGMATASISSWETMPAAVSRTAQKPISKQAFFISGGKPWPGRRPVDDPKLEAAVTAAEKARSWPAYGNTYRPDRHTIAIALEYLRVHRPRLLHVGLGDADEHGHHDDYGAYIAAVRELDAFIGDLTESLASLGLAQSTTVILVSDHGRATAFKEHGPTYPESGRTFLIGIGDAIAKHGEVCAARDVWLTDVAPTVAALLGLPKDRTEGAAGAPISELTGP